MEEDLFHNHHQVINVIQENGQLILMFQFFR